MTGQRIDLTELKRLIEKADGYWWDGSPDGEYFPIAVEIGNWCMAHGLALVEAVEAAHRVVAADDALNWYEGVPDLDGLRRALAPFVFGDEEGKP